MNMGNTGFGKDATLSYKTGGVGGQGQWTVCGTVRDVNPKYDAAEVDVTTRGSGPWKRSAPAHNSVSADFEVLMKANDPGYAAFMDAWLNRTIIGLKFVDAEGGGTFQGDFAVLSLAKSEPLDGAVTVSLSVTLGDSDTAPSYTPASGPA
jgi:predicted secreted protein